ncbi:YceI family protein [Paenibacillus senegalimassiliensis]|uniref:YceI family protein n=1 Tax=Paenibacillus senegalimassiliensis TaxID=1737426 RepID=UPI00073EBFE0|nr:YceI family protein [Paenibacillus senegalimassiliensis]
MKKKTMTWIITGVVLAGVIGGGGYALMNNYLGNNVEIETVIPANNASGNPKQTASAAAGEVVSQDLVNGNWSITDASKVYFSVTTSKETVNFVNNIVSGQWQLDVNDLAQSTAIGTIDMNAVDSSNAQRDEHIKSADYFDVAQYPNATFEGASFEGLPTDWTEGTAYYFTMTGTLNVRGIDKEVTFAGTAMYQGEELLLSSSTMVTFDDFGLENPHSVVLSAENDIQVRLELVLSKS